MAFTVRFIFQGVCAFIPDSPFFIKERGKWNCGDPSQVTVLLPSIRDARSSSWKENGKTVLREPHWALVTIKECHLNQNRCERNQDLTPRPPDLTWEGKFNVVIDDQEVEYKGRWASMALWGEKITIKPHKPQKLDVDLKVPANQYEPSEKDETSLWWLPRMAELSPSSSKVENSLKPGAGDLPTSLSASLEITEGNLHVLGFNLDNHNQKRGWTFTPPWRWWHDLLPPKRSWKRPIGNTLGLVLEDQDGPLRLGFEMGTELFAEIEGPEGSIVDIFVSNMELEDRFLERVVEDNYPDPPNQDPDFEDLYALSRGPGAKGPVPDRRASDAGPKRTPCAPGGFDGWKKG